VTDASDFPGVEPDLHVVVRMFNHQNAADKNIGVAHHRGCGNESLGANTGV